MFIFFALKNAVRAADCRPICSKILPLPRFLSAGYYTWRCTFCMCEKIFKWYMCHLWDEQLECFRPPQFRDIELSRNYSESLNSDYFITVKHTQNRNYYSNLRYLRITWIFVYVAYNSFKFRFYSLKILVLRNMVVDILIIYFCYSRNYNVLTIIQSFI